MQETRRHTHRLQETVEIELQRVRTAQQPSPIDARPHGHVVAHGRGDPATRSFDGHPHGHVVGHGPGDPAARSFDGHPHGHVVGHGPGDPTSESLDGRPHGHVVGRAIGDPARPYPMDERTGASAVTPSAYPVPERAADRRAA